MAERESSREEWWGSPPPSEKRAVGGSAGISVITRGDAGDFSLTTELLQVGRHQARYLELQSTLHVVRGSILLRSHRGECVMNGGDIYVCEPSELTLLTTISEHPAVLRTLRLPAECGPSRGEAPKLATRNARITEAPQSQAFVSRIIVAFEQGNLDLVDSLVRSPVRATVITNALERGAPSHSLLPRTVRSIRNQILDGLTRNDTLEELARVSVTSTRSASRVFKMRLLVSVHKFRLCARITAAARRLVAGDSVAGTARAVGFVDESHLTKHFKRTFGVSPSAYARAIVRLSRRQLRAHVGACVGQAMTKL